MGARAGPRAGPGPCAGVIGAETAAAGAPPGATLLAAGDPEENPGPEGGGVPEDGAPGDDAPGDCAPRDGDGTAPGVGGGKPLWEAMFKPGPGAGAKAKPEAESSALPDPEAGPKAACGDGAEADEGEGIGDDEEAGNGAGGDSKPGGGRGPNIVGLASAAGAGAIGKASGTPGNAKHSLSNDTPWPRSSLNSFVYDAVINDMQQALVRESSQDKQTG